jgi:surface antigen
MQWLQLRIGTSIDIDGAYGAQCVDAINDYLAEINGAPRVHGNAIDIPRQSIHGFTWRGNTAENAPRPGSIVVWNADDPILHIGPYGHVAVAVLADRWGLITADQNWAGAPRLALYAHTYRSVAGWHYPSS